MAQSLISPLIANLITRRCVCALALFFAGFTVPAQAADPTRPPNEFTGGNTTSSSDLQPAFNGQGLVLQSVLMSAKRQRAQISGQTIPLGGRIGDAKLIKITETYVVLQGAQGTQTLELTPGIRKRQPEALAKPQNNKKQRHSGGKP